jgi:hypothetical protein
MPKKTIPLPGWTELFPSEPGWSSELFPSDNQWVRLRRYIPGPLRPEDEARLREDIRAACSWLLTEQERLARGVRTHVAMQKPGNRQPALLESLADHLRAAATAWKKIMDLADSPQARRGIIYDDRLSAIRHYDALETMARDAERRLARIRKLGKAEYVDDPWPLFVRKVADCCRKIKPGPTATGRIYEGGKPTWFQEFMFALDNNLLGYKRSIGIDREGKQKEHDPRAFYAEIAKAMGGYKNSGKARKQITGR